MPYVLSKLANNQIYVKYARNAQNGVNIPEKKILIKGGADIINKNLITPEGVVTEVAQDELEILKENAEFKRHLEGGFVKYFATKPNVEKQTQYLEKDNSKQLTPDDYKKKGKKAPKVEIQEDEE